MNIMYYGDCRPSVGNCSTTWLSSQWKCFSYLQSEPLVSIIAHPPAMHHCKQLVCPLGGLLIGMVRLPGDPPQSLPFSRLNKPVPSASPHSSGAPGLSASWCPSGKPAPIYYCPSCIAGWGGGWCVCAKLQYFRCGLLSSRGRKLPSSTAVHTSCSCS